LAEETICTGWLLFSVGDYDWEALSKEIWDFIGVKVAVKVSNNQRWEEKGTKD